MLESSGCSGGKAVPSKVCYHVSPGGAGGGGGGWVVRFGKRAGTGSGLEVSRIEVQSSSKRDCEAERELWRRRRGEVSRRSAGVNVGWQ